MYKQKHINLRALWILLWTMGVLTVKKVENHFFRMQKKKNTMHNTNHNAVICLSLLCLHWDNGTLSLEVISARWFLLLSLGSLWSPPAGWIFCIYPPCICAVQLSRLCCVCLLECFKMISASSTSSSMWQGHEITQALLFPCPVMWLSNSRVDCRLIHSIRVKPGHSVWLLWHI